MLEEAGTGITVRNGEELYDRIHRLLRNPEAMEERGSKGRMRVMANRGASRRYADLVVEVLEGRKHRAKD